MLVNDIDLKDTELHLRSSSKALTKYSKSKAVRNSLMSKAWKAFYTFSKRSFDIVCGIIGCICLLPILLLVKIAYLRHGDKAPILFKQERIGKGGKTICMYKIRSMVHNAGQVLEELMEKDPAIREEYTTNKKLENDPRVTRVGKILRKTSLDEFGQFINVLKGDMTMIGPRPYLPREKEDMGNYYKYIIQCKPGITGYWQTSGRSDVTFDDRLKMDFKYCQKRSLKVDAKLLMKTILNVVKKEGAI